MKAKISQLSPRSRNQWELAKSRFKKKLAQHAQVRRNSDSTGDGEDDDEDHNTDGDGNDDNQVDDEQLDATDFRKAYKLHWSPDDLWKTLQHVISRHARHEPGQLAASKRRSSVSSQRQQQDNNYNTTTGARRQQQSRKKRNADDVDEVRQRCGESCGL